MTRKRDTVSFCCERALSNRPDDDRAVGTRDRKIRSRIVALYLSPAHARRRDSLRETEPRANSHSQRRVFPSSTMTLSLTAAPRRCNIRWLFRGRRARSSREAKKIHGNERRSRLSLELFENKRDTSCRRRVVRNFQRWLTSAFSERSREDSISRLLISHTSRN